MDYKCEHCGYDFFMEEGYDPVTDIIKCPNCGCVVAEELE